MTTRDHLWFEHSHLRHGIMRKYMEQAPGLSLWLQQHINSHGPTKLCGQTGNLQQEHSWVFHRGRPGSISTSLRAGLSTVYVRSVWGKGHIEVRVCKLGGI